MCSKIPWSSFLLAVVLVLFGYYLLIGVLFYRKDVVRWFSRRSLRSAPDQPPRNGPQPTTESDNTLSRDTDRAGEPIA